VGSTTLLTVNAAGGAGNPCVDSTVIVVVAFVAFTVKGEDATEIPAGLV